MEYTRNGADCVLEPSRVKPFGRYGQDAFTMASSHNTRRSPKSGVDGRDNNSYLLGVRLWTNPGVWGIGGTTMSEQTLSRVNDGNGQMDEVNAAEAGSFDMRGPPYSYSESSRLVLSRIYNISRFPERRPMLS